MQLGTISDECAIKFVFVNDVSNGQEFFRTRHIFAMFLIYADYTRDQFNRQIDGLLGIIHN